MNTFKVCRVANVARHPNADRLTVCVVETEPGVFTQVICGAPNVREGLLTVFAGIGTMVFAGTDMEFTISACTIRRIESFGMLCSERELGISSKHDGIIELEEGTVGSEFKLKSE